jgi:predicted acetyltransferase
MATPALPRTLPAALPRGLDLRAVDPDAPETASWLDLVATVFKDSRPITPERIEARRPVWRQQRLTGVFDGPRAVGSYRSWDLDLTVPGGQLRADAISSVTVAPTHRRRGLLTAMIQADLAAAVEREVPVAVLIASQAPIYGRYGFGAATESATWAVTLSQAQLRPEVDLSCSAELVTETELRRFAPAIYAGSRLPGAIDRDEHWWDLDCGVVSLPGHERGVHRAVLVREADGRPSGFLHYRSKEDWPDRDIRTVVDVEDLHAQTPAAYTALWNYLLGLDLVATVRAEDRAVDEPLPWLLTDPRAARQTSRCDFEWTRLLDPVAALTARRYEIPGRAVIEVVDPEGWAAGTFLVEADGSGSGSCTRTDREPDLSMQVDALSSLWLGGGDLAAKALAGRVRQRRPDALPRIAALLRTARTPWTGTWF